MKTVEIQITGVVQGVGFRPFIYNLARTLNIKGFVLNNSRGVEIIASAVSESLEDFISSIPKKAPAQAEIDSIRVNEIIPEEEYKQFEIRESLVSAGKFTRISPDLMLCQDCLNELLNPDDRRYYYPYINCTNCGPRYTIIRDVPYDRPKTTMADFGMCEACEKEYKDPTDRRFHAQPNACHQCGPHLELTDINGEVIISENSPDSSRELFSMVAELLKKGKIISIKGLGGFHIACDATNEEAVRKLRSRKYREDKPFALMVSSPEMAEELVNISDSETERLLRRDRPILLLPKIENCPVAPSVAPGNRFLGIMLPYTPVHYLLFQQIHFPLVMTSANISDEPIAFTNEDALERLRNIVDYHLMGNREIHIRCDDSVIRLWNGLDYPLRRSRGMTPTPIRLEKSVPDDILAVGAEQKNTTCVLKGEWAILSHHIGDLENVPTLRSFEQSIRHLCNVFDIHPCIIAHDLHPEYLSTKAVKEPFRSISEFVAGREAIGVQHHHAHVVSCMAENGIYGDVIGIALDGTGYGTDGTIWGGEILIANESEFSREARFRRVIMPGGAVAIKNPWRMALAYLIDTYGENCSLKNLSFPGEIQRKELEMARFQIINRLNSPLTSSCGRLFDGVASLVGLRNHANYEGQPAVELEQTVEYLPDNGYPFHLDNSGETMEIDWRPCISAIAEDLKKSVPISEMAGKFHTGVIKTLVKATEMLSKRKSLHRVVLSGGCFMNMILLTELHKRLKSKGLEVYTHRQVPCNDGGIALGQAVIAASKKNR